METEIIKVNPREIKLLELNARYMKQDEYKRLVENVKADKGLSSVPFCCYDEDWNLECLSGNHRVMASIDAGLKEIDVMVTRDELSEGKKRAIQLSHNAIEGQDDLAILKEIYEGIEDVELREYSGLDDELLHELEKIGTQSMASATLDFQVLQIVVLPDELERAKEVIEKVKKEIKGMAFTLRFGEYDKWLDTMETVGKSVGIKNTATVLMSMLDLVEKHIGELREKWEREADGKQWIPINTLTGSSKIRASDGRKVEKAVQLLFDKGEIKKNERYKAFGILAEKYLNQEKERKKEREIRKGIKKGMDGIKGNPKIGKRNG